MGTTVFTKDDDVQKWQALLDNIPDDAPTFDEILLRGGLSSTQKNVLQANQRYLEDVLRLRGGGWTVAINGPPFIRRLADLLIIFEGPLVAGRKKRFIKRMFGAHAKPHARRRRKGVVTLGASSAELWTTLFELTLVGFFVEQGFNVTLEPELPNGKVPEFRADRGTDTLYVEAKSVSDERLHAILHPQDASMGRFALSASQIQSVGALVERTLTDAKEKFADVEHPYCIFVKIGFPCSAFREVVETSVAATLASAAFASGVTVVSPLEVTCWSNPQARRPLEDFVVAKDFQRLAE